MRKDNIRDYATSAFREYARQGCPSYAEASEKRDVALAADLCAVSDTLRLFSDEGKEYIVDAVRAVYFITPRIPLKKGDVGARVSMFANEYPASIRSVYGWLKKARMKFASIRGLRMQ